MNSERNNEEEIDFGPLFNWAKRIVQSILSALYHWVVKMYKQRYKIALWSILCGGIAVGISFLIPRQYYSELTLMSRGVESKLLYDKVSIVGTLIDDESFEIVADLLNLSVPTIEKIHSIEYDMNPPSAKDSIDGIFFFKVNATVFDNTILDSLQGAFLSYLSEIDFVQQRKELHQKRTQKLISKLRNEINQLDSLKEIVAQSLIPKGGQQGFIYGEPLDPITVYREGIDLYEKELDLEIFAETLDPIQIVTEYSTFLKPTFPKKKYFAAIGLGLGALLSIFFFSRRP